MKTKLVYAAYVIGGLLLLSLYFIPHFDREYYIYEVTKSERVCNSDNNCEYLVFTKERTFKNVDSFVELKFDSSDLHGRIEEGKTYGISTYGFRIPWLSVYENIIDIDEVK